MPQMDSPRCRWRRGLKEGVQQGTPSIQQIQCASQQEEYQIHQKDGAGAAQGLVLEPPPKAAGAAAAKNTARALRSRTASVVT